MVVLNPDVGDASWMCPTAQINTATWAPQTPGHSWQVVSQGKSEIAHKGMLYAGKSIALAAIKMMEEPERIAKARKEYDEVMKDQECTSDSRGDRAETDQRDQIVKNIKIRKSQPHLK